MVVMRQDFAPTPQQALDRLRYATDRGYNKNMAAIELSARLLVMLGMIYQVLAEGSGRDEIRNQFENIIITKVGELLNQVSMSDDQRR